MGKFSFLEQYISNESTEKNPSQQRHIFYKVSNEEVDKAEQRMGRVFPKELRDFYMEIGYGFLCLDDTSHVNRVMHPDDIADFVLGEEKYAYVDRDIYNSDEMVFFDLGDEGDFLTMDRDSAICYFGEKIASSLGEFLRKMDEDTNYYIGR